MCNLNANVLELLSSNDQQHIDRSARLISYCVLMFTIRDENYSQCRLNCPDPAEHDNWDCQLDGTFMTPEEQAIQAYLYAGLMQACIDLGPTVCTVFQVFNIFAYHNSCLRFHHSFSLSRPGVWETHIPVRRG